MKLLERWLFDRPYSIATFAAFGLAAALLKQVAEPLLFVPLVILIVLLVYVSFIAPWRAAKRRGCD